MGYKERFSNLPTGFGESAVSLPQHNKGDFFTCSSGGVVSNIGEHAADDMSSERSEGMAASELSEMGNVFSAEEDGAGQ